jgi:hypothetical protein
MQGVGPPEVPVLGPRLAGVRLPGDLPLHEPPRGIAGPDQRAAGRHQRPIALLARPESRLDLLAAGDVALRAPGADQVTVAHDADHVVQEVAALTVAAELVRLGIRDPVAAAEERAKVLDVRGIAPRQQLGEAYFYCPSRPRT